MTVVSGDYCNVCMCRICCIKINQIDNINTIYKNTPFGTCGSGFGFEIKEVTLCMIVLLEYS